MSKDKKNEANTNPEPVKAVAPPVIPSTIKIVELTVGEEYTEPDGWILNEVHSIDVEAGKFFGVLVKRKPATSRISQPVNLKS